MCRAAFGHVAVRTGSTNAARVQFIQINEYASMLGENFHEGMRDNLCGSGANDSFHNFGDKSGMSLAGNWVPTLNSNKSITIEWCVTAHHIGGYLEYYITRPDVDINIVALKQEHFTLFERIEHTVLIKDDAKEECTAGQYFRDVIDLPPRPDNRNYVILARWQRRVEADGSTEGFYNCIDMVNQIAK